MKKVLIGGIGNILLGDDGVGPYVLRLLDAMYEFDESVETVDLGTPALDLIYKISGLDALIVIDAVANDEPPGAVNLYRKADILRNAPSVRMDPHSPALTESLLAAELLGDGPEEVMLVGISVGPSRSGCDLSGPVQRAVGSAIGTVLMELERLGITYEKRYGIPPDIWWTQAWQTAPA